MKILKDSKLCNGCHACYSACPQNCISMEPNNEGFLFPKVNNAKCISCDICKNICPMNKTQIDRTGESILPKAFAVTHKNEEILLGSSSGGAFSLFAEHIINEGGVVFGAKFNENWEVIHDYTETIEGLSSFRGSKYVQSKIDDIYKKVEYFLTNGEDRKVLFSGTPCQIGGLKSYLKKDYNNLFCIDLICKGIPSPKAWIKYIDLQKNIANKSNIKYISFRKKPLNESWKYYLIYFSFQDCYEYSEVNKTNIYMKAFRKYLTMRNSCFKCGYKTLNRLSDITLGDFWTVNNILPEMYNEKGVSKILIQSEKGMKLFDLVKNNSYFKEFDSNRAVNQTFYTKKIPKYRSNFMKNIDKNPFNNKLKKYLYGKENILKKNLMKIKKIIIK